MPKFSKKEALKYGWEKFKEHKWFWLGIEVVVFVILSVLALLVESAEEAGSSALFSLLQWAVQILLSLGFIYISLKIYNGFQPHGADLLEPAENFFRYLGASVLYMLILVGGVLLLIIPGFIWSIKYYFYGYLIVDKKMGPLEALSKSGQITYGEKWNLFLFGLLLGLVNMAGALLAGIGLLVSLPVSWMALVYVYRKLLAEEDIILEAVKNPST